MESNIYYSMPDRVGKSKYIAYISLFRSPSLIVKYVDNILTFYYNIYFYSEEDLAMVENFCNTNNISYVSFPQKLKIEITTKSPKTIIEIRYYTDVLQKIKVK